MKSAWARLSSRERAIFCVTVAVVGFALAWQFAVRPYAAEIESLDARIEAKEIRLARLERSAASANIASGTAREEHGLHAAAKPASPDQEMSRTLKAIASMAHASSIRITDLKPLASTGNGGIPQLSIDVQTQASLAQLSRFLYELQTSPLALSVPRFSLGAPEGPGDFRLKLSLTIIRGAR